MATNPTSSTQADSDDEKVKLGFWVVIVGMVIAGLILAVAMFRYSTAQDVATSIGPLTTLIGTLAGAFFGQQIGSAGKDKAQKTAIKLAASSKLTPQEIKALLD